MSNESIDPGAVTASASKQTRQPSTGQRPLFAVAAGIGAAIAGTALWIFIAQKYQMTWMSVAVAFGIASAIKYAGRATSPAYGAAGALLSLLTAIAGNLATAVFIISKRGSTPCAIISQLDPSTVFVYLRALSGPAGIIFYAAALYVGFWFAFDHPKKSPMEELPN